MSPETKTKYPSPPKQRTPEQLTGPPAVKITDQPHSLLNYRLHHLIREEHAQNKYNQMRHMPYQCLENSSTIVKDVDHDVSPNQSSL
ncbi:hypothetical protein V6N13_109804 [Hibiscus sabdariffa]